MLCPMCTTEHESVDEIKPCFDKLARIVGNQYLLHELKIPTEYRTVSRRMLNYVKHMTKGQNINIME